MVSSDVFPWQSNSKKLFDRVVLGYIMIITLHSVLLYRERDRVQKRNSQSSREYGAGRLLLQLGEVKWIVGMKAEAWSLYRGAYERQEDKSKV